MTSIAHVAGVQANLAQVLWPSDSALRHAVLIAIGSVALTLSAKLQIPFWPVPMTMQTVGWASHTWSAPQVAFSSGSLPPPRWPVSWQPEVGIGARRVRCLRWRSRIS